MVRFFLFVIVIIAIQAIGVLLWALLLNAPILQWRARVLRNWSINYKDAYFVSIKAGLVALVVADVIISAIFFSGNPTVAMLCGILFGSVSWWFAHSNALLKLAGPSSLLSAKDARSISASVFGLLFLVVFALILVERLVNSLVSL